MIFNDNKIIKISLLFVFLIFNIYGVSTSSETKRIDVEDDYTITDSNQFVVPKFKPDEVESVSKKIDSLMKRFHKRYDFNGSILIAKKGKLVFNGHYGYANFRKKNKIDDNSIFQLASVTKQFTAVSILILSEKGLLNLNDKVVQYIPEFPYDNITIKHLLNHTSGLPKYFWLAEHEWKKEEAPSNKDMMQMVIEYNLPLFFKPGAVFDYSNTGYFVLANLIERITGDSYGDFLDKHIFKPLQMNHSYVYRFQKDSVKQNQLSGYRLHRGWRHLEISGTVNDAITGDKNVYSTTEDLFKWVIGLNSGKIISKKSLELMYKKGKTKYGRSIPYGFGFRIDDRLSEKVIYHNGKWNGFSTSVKQFEDSDLTIITLEHSSYRSMKHLHNKIKTIIANDLVIGS